jgi:tetratricopeptide (TPR) repeat protein
MAGGLLLILILVLGYPVFTKSGGSDSSPATDPLSGPPAGLLDLSELSPREAADQLFDRVMRGLSAGDTEGAMGFMSMAINAYQLLDSLDADGRFHLALLQLRAGQADESLASARAGLELFPDHLLLLSTAGDAAVEVGDDAAAEAFFRRTLEVYDAEVAKQLWEYQAHDGLLPDIRTTAESFLTGR